MHTEHREVRRKPLQFGRTYHRKRTLRKMKTTGKATGNHPGKYVIHKTVCNATTPFCSVDMPSQPLTWSITTRHVKNIINVLVTAED